MVTTVYLIRHGETENSHPKRYKGHSDVPLSEVGGEQIKRLAEYISGEASKRGSKEVVNSERSDLRTRGLSAIYCSDLSRAVKSAEIIAEPFGLTPIIVKELRERNFGMWEGMTFDEIEKNWPDAFRAWSENPLAFSPVGGESTLEARDRVMKAFHHILNNHINTSELSRSGVSDSGGPYIALVSHGGVIRIILCELLGIPLENIFRIEQDVGALNVIEMWDYPVVKRINYIV